MIASAVRTLVGSFGGVLAKVSAIDLGVIAANEAIKRAGIHPEMIDEVILGNVLGAGLKQNVARQVTLGAGMPETTPAMTINKVCGSGLRSVSLAAQMIMLGDTDVVLAGGTESMSNVPYLLPNARWGQRMNDGKMIDYMIYDGLWDIFNDYHMGIIAENVAEKWNITWEEQDEFALESQQKTEKAQKEDKFKGSNVRLN